MMEKKPILGMLYEPGKATYLILNQEEILQLIQEQQKFKSEKELYEEAFHTELLRRVFSDNSQGHTFQERYARVKKQMFKELQETKNLNSG